MNRIFFIVILLCIQLIPAGVSSAQSFASSSFGAKNENSGAVSTAMSPARPTSTITAGPLTRVALGGSVSPLGIGAEFSTNLNPHLNLRSSASFFDQPIHFATNGFHADAQLKLASANASIDICPFHSGFRVSPGVMFYNQNRITASDTIASGTSFTLNGDTFYSASTNTATGATPVKGSALLNLHATRPAFTITGGWGNPLARNGHWSFPVEVGVAFVGAPVLNVKLAGWACHDQARTQCTDISNLNNPIAVRVQNDLHVEVSTWTRDLEPLKTYPIVKAGVSYSFNTGRR